MPKKDKNQREGKWRTIIGSIFIVLILFIISFVYNYGYFESRNAFIYKTCLNKQLQLTKIRDGAARECLRDTIIKIGEKNRIEPELIWAVISTESTFNHRAVSRQGALGLMQIMPNTATELGLEDPFDPVENIEAGSRYLKKLLDRYNGDATYALAAYNAGLNVVERYKGIPPYDETKNYVSKVIGIYLREKGRGSL